MLKKKISTIATFIVAGALLAGAGTYAWFTQQESAANLTFTAGEVNYEVEEVTSSATVVPGDYVLEDALQVVNKSTIKTNVRFQITCTVDGLACNVGPDNTDQIKITLPSNPVVVEDADGWFYYLAKDAGDASDDVAIATSSTEDTLTLIPNEGLQINGAVVGNDYMNKAITITITFQAKQADHLTWADAASTSIDFETGLAS